MEVVGIDPAPRKGATLVSDSLKNPLSISPQELVSSLSKYRECGEFKYARDRSILICSDAPLTGPADPTDSAGVYDWDFTQRPIEAFFNRTSGMKAPRGISVRPYSGCSHWSISRASLGLLRVGPYCASEIPCDLVTSENKKGAVKKAGAAFVVEVHPAVAIWLWCSTSGFPGGVSNDWSYKSSAHLPFRKMLVEHLLGQILNKTEQHRFAHWKDTTPNDDELDASIAWVLGRRWIDGVSVVLLGNRKTGAILVPNVQIGGSIIGSHFGRFLDREFEPVAGLSGKE